MDSLSHFCIPTLKYNALPLLVLNVKEGKKVGRKGGRKDTSLGRLDAISAPPEAIMKSTVLSFVFSSQFYQVKLR